MPFLPALSIRDQTKKNGQALFFLAYKKPFTFEISYTHSVNKGRVTDFYSVENQNIVLESTHFSNYGAGMSDPEPGQTFRSGEGYIEIGNINRHFTSINLAVGLVAEHALFFNNKTYWLKDFWPAQSSLIISYRHISIFTYLRNL